MNLYVRILCGQNCSRIESAKPLYEAIRQALSTCAEDIVVDYTGTTEISYEFLSVIAGLLDLFKKEILDARVKFVGMDNNSFELFGVVMGHAHQYMTNPAYEAIIDFVQNVTPQATPVEQPPITETQETQEPTKGKQKAPVSPHVQVPTTLVE